MVTPRQRAQKIFRHIEKNEKMKVKPEVIILANGTEPHLDASFFYITGFPYGLFEGSFLVARRNGDISLVTTPLEEPIARAHAKGIAVYKVSEKNAIRLMVKKLAGSSSTSIGLNSGELSYKSFLEIKSIFKSSKLVDSSEAFEAARLVKDENEVELIQKACNIASSAYNKIPSMLKDGTSESQIAASIAFEMQKSGGSGVSFDTIVAFGKNSAEPHYSAGSARLKAGQFVLCDYGTKFRRYCSDITRTLVYGRASTEQRRMHEIVQSARALGTELCTPENEGSFVHRKVSELINSTEFKGRFIHSTGHSLGLAVHDGPGLSRTNDKKLQPGMVLTVEPGIYVPGVGGVRIEDDVLITRNKPRILTSAHRELIEV